MNAPGLTQQFLEMMVAKGKARARQLPSNCAILTRFCATCGTVTEQLSFEERYPDGTVAEVITCGDCATSRTYITR